MPVGVKTTAQEAAAKFQDNIKGKNVLITGVSPKALGGEVVRVLAPYASNIIIASRSVERAEEAIAETRKANPNTKFSLVSLDLTSLEAIRKTGEKINALNIPINVVLNNAGVTMEDNLKRTKDGFEWQFGGNHLGHFLLTSIIYPSILASKPTEQNPAVIVNVASAVHFHGIRIDDINYEAKPEDYDRWVSYGSSKSANILFSHELAKRCAKDHVKAMSLHPGAIGSTNMGSSTPLAVWVAIGLLNEDGSVKDDLAWKPIEIGTATHIVAGFDPSIPTGSYLSDGEVHNDQLSPHAKDDALAVRLWEMSEKLTGQKWDLGATKIQSAQPQVIKKEKKSFMRRLSKIVGLAH